MSRPPDRRRGGPEDTTPRDRPSVEPPSHVTDKPMVTGDGDGEPLPLSEVISGLLELSDLLDGQLRQRLAAYREGYEHGRGVGYDQGYDDGIAERKRVQQDMVAALKVHGRRWELRGEPRARETFGRPHPGDYQGREGVA